MTDGPEVGTSVTVSDVNSIDLNRSSESAAGRCCKAKRAFSPAPACETLVSPSSEHVSDTPRLRGGSPREIVEISFITSAAIIRAGRWMLDDGWHRVDGVMGHWPLCLDAPG